ncbi:DJ-1 family protein [Trichomonas vaginalis G3]|uniref:DJ-1 family protein n=1 Tax=Trichomonas vaginalis (strain ATCC PRA-98 / G3) TaxID=412133 RepID=A2ED65_TRIV3|nr:guanine deglycation, methylglyoxal removal [Trichomonas vaginalis G3]EAY09420.1 DJ-1 family protein [Trichomonas vaginalis G3]KAI5536341.1 guanine deglycation, methylglyoxal removal [Trichomonas vaginalis G3]|eukprot:XP_001321643.1 DJ-1 family protein [Trichomonas vaginalis G3]
MPKVLVLAATGFEPMELVNPTDLLRRAGADVKVAAVGTQGLQVDAAHGVKIVADVKFDAVKNETFDLIIAPGGMPGTKNLAANHDVVEFIKRHDKAGKLVGAICAAPGFVLAQACGIMKGRKGCGYPGCDNAIAETGGELTTDAVTRDGNVITSRGPGTSQQFGLALIEALISKEKAHDVAKGAILA